MADLTDFVKKSLGLEWIEDLGGVGGGCISDSRSYQTQNGKLFVKTHEQEKVEYCSMISLPFLFTPFSMMGLSMRYPKYTNQIAQGDPLNTNWDNNGI